MIKNIFDNRKILIIVNHDITIYNFRRELIERLLAENYDLFISSPYGERIEKLKELGCHFIDTIVQRHGLNPIKDYSLFYHYLSIMKEIKPAAVLTYTIKPNIYGAMAAQIRGIPCIANITGLGTALRHKGIIQTIAVCLYKISFRKIHCVFFQNSDNMNFFQTKKIALGKHRLLPGSGVNLKEFALLPFPETIRIAFVSRIMKEKGIEEFLKCSEALKAKIPEIYFDVCGFCEEGYEHTLKKLEEKGVLTYHGMVPNIKEILCQVQCVVLPSYHEGMSNALLEAASTGRILIASDIPGCREIIDDGISGYCFPAGNVEELQKRLETVISLPLREKLDMGLAGRKRMEALFDRTLVVNAYLEEIQKICGGKNVTL